MNGKPVRLLVILVLLAAGAAAGILLSRKKADIAQPISAGPFSGACVATLPDKLARPAWLPSDFPLPQGTYASQTFPAEAGVNRAVFTVNADLNSFVKLVLNEWPSSGYTLTGKGEREAGEAEAPFKGPGKTAGLFRARAIYCDATHTEMLLALTATKG